MKFITFTGARVNLLKKLGRQKRAPARRGVLLGPMMLVFFFATLLLPVWSVAADPPEFALSKSSARPGEMLDISSVDSCPPKPSGSDYYFVQFTFVDADDVRTVTTWSIGVNDYGSWNGSTSGIVPWRDVLGHHTPIDTINAAAIGPASIEARCIAGQEAGDDMDPDDDILQTTQTYGAEPFTVTGPSREFTLSANSVATGQTVHLASTNPCDGTTVSGSIISNQGVSNFDTTTDSNGHWEVDVVAASEDMDSNLIDLPGGVYEVNAVCYSSATGVTVFYGEKTITVTVPPANYVALGDSYSSGEGLDPFEAGTENYSEGGNACHRSSQAYPRLLDANSLLPLRLGSNGFTACSGATTAAITLGNTNEGAQMDKITADTDLITMTIGGNNMDFEAFANQCFWGNCSGQDEDDAIERISDDVISRTEYMLGTIRDRLITLDNSDAKVLVIGYPQLVTNQPYLDNLEAAGCEWLDGQTEADAIRNVVTHLNVAVKNEVNAIGYDFHFVSANESGSPFAGHELCRDSFVYGMPYFFNVSLPQVYSFHPNSLGQQAYATLIENYLSTHPL